MICFIMLNLLLFPLKQFAGLYLYLSNIFKTKRDKALQILLMERAVNLT